MKNAYPILKLTFAFILLQLCVTSGVFAQQTGGIRGRITTSDGKPADYISVKLKEKASSTFTNSKGEFRFSNLKAGDYTVRVSGVGLSADEKMVSVVAGSIATVDFSLSENSAQLEAVTIEGKKNKYKVDKPSSSLRLDAPLQQIPQNIQIVTSSALADQQIISMSDGVARNVSGVTKLEHWGDLYTRVNMRGSRASAFRNGMNVTSTWGPLTEDMSFVDHIEFVKGPAGFMMSNGEPSGIYNIVTKKPTGSDFNGEFTAMLGSYDTYRTTIDLDGKLNESGKIAYRFNGMAQTKNSFRAYEYSDRQSFAPVLSFKLDDQTTLIAEYNYQHAKMSNVGSYYSFANEDYAVLPRKQTLLVQGLEPTKIDDHSGFLYLIHNFNDSWKITGQLAYFNYQQEGSSAWPSGQIKANGDMIRGINIWDAANESKFGQVFVNGSAKTGSISHKILAGLDLGTKRYMADWSQAHNLDTEASPYNIYKTGFQPATNGLPVFDRSKPLSQRAGGNVIQQSYNGLYLQEELGLLEDKLRLTIAGRYTEVQESTYGTPTKDRRFTPRFGISGSVLPSFSIYALYDQSFVPQSGIIRGGNQPKPITGNNLEAGLKKDWFNNTWNTTLSVYKITKNNELTPDPNQEGGVQYSVQLGQNVSSGLEFDVRGNITNGLNLVANYAYTNSEITEAGANTGAGVTEGSKIPGYAKHNTNAWLTYTLQNGTLKGFGLSGGFSYQIDRTTWDWGGATGTKPLPDYFRLDAGAFWSRGKIKFNFNAYNVLDKYLYSGGYYAYGGYYNWQAEAPRNYRLSMAYKF